MEVIIIILDDEEKFKDASLTWEIKEIYGDENVIVINNSNEGLQFIKDNMTKNLIILLDIQFPPDQHNGHKLLHEIVGISKLIPVILFSGIDENKEEFADFINNHAFGFLSKKATSEVILSKIKEAYIYLENSIDNTIEDWIIAKDEDKDKPVYFTSNGKSYSLNQILFEIRMQTDVGKSFSKKLNELTIDLLIRSKKRIDD